MTLLIDASDLFLSQPNLTVHQEEHSQKEEEYKYVTNGYEYPWLSFRLCEREFADLQNDDNQHYINILQFPKSVAQIQEEFVRAEFERRKRGGLHRIATWKRGVKGEI